MKRRRACPVRAGGKTASYAVRRRGRAAPTGHEHRLRPLRRLEDLPIPLHVIACDVLAGREVRLSAGPLVDAVMASAAIPGVLPPVEWDGRLLIDGGATNNAPLSHALELGADE